jgi:Mrp family chromosome partitioning ATPase
MAMLGKANKSNGIKLATSEKLEGYFATLARQIIDWQKLSKDRFSFGVLGCARKVGASTVATSVASALSETESSTVLLIESDFGSSSLARNENKNLAGLADVLSGQADPLSTICATTYQDLYVMGCGAVAAEEALHLPVPKFSGLLEDLRNEFSLVIVDLPHASESNCSYPLASQLDGVALVAPAEQVDGDQIRHIQKRIPIGRLLGLVLNKA